MKHDHAHLLEIGWECTSLGDGLTTLWHPPFPHDRAYFAFEAPGIQAEHDAGRGAATMRCPRCSAPVPTLRDPVARTSVIVAGFLTGILAVVVALATCKGSP